MTPGACCSVVEAEYIYLSFLQQGALLCVIFGSLDRPHSRTLTQNRTTPRILILGWLLEACDFGETAARCGAIGHATPPQAAGLQASIFPAHLDLGRL